MSLQTGVTVNPSQDCQPHRRELSFCLILLRFWVSILGPQNDAPRGPKPLKVMSSATPLAPSSLTVPTSSHPYSARYPGSWGRCQLAGLGLSFLRNSGGPQLDAQGGCWSSRVWQAWKVEEEGPPHALGPGRQPTDVIFIPGNIRVLCRLRPGTPSSLVSSEPGPSGTVTTCYRGRQRRFHLDWVFSPEASQEEVMPHPCACAGLPSYCP